MKYSAAGVSFEGAIKLLEDGLDDVIKWDFPLTPDSIVLDVGGYDGSWTSQLIKWLGFCPKVFVFEPITVFYQAACHALKGYEKVRVLNYGLHDSNEDCIFHRDPGGHQTGRYYDSSKESISVRLRDVAEVLQELGLQNIDLLASNIEGGEYLLLSRLINTKWIERVDRLLVQFHAKLENSEERRMAINKRLSETHTQIYDYPFVWDSWKRK